jgi:E3 ubiquitin-protein ligase RNF213
VSYQGSESSTSEGISATFAKAQQYAARNPGTIPVVLLDEVGLAELSPHNPLKVLHALLEPATPQAGGQVAVVGISNWALDAAKMNRAIMLSR